MPVQDQPTEAVVRVEPLRELHMAEPAAGEAVRAHLVIALRLARMLVNDPTTAEDIAAESVARLLAARGRARIENADAYLRRIVVNQVIGRRRRFATEQKFASRFVAADRTTDPGDAIIGRMSLGRALTGLTPQQRAVLVLRYYEDMPEAAVADLLHIPIGTVKSSASRGLEELRRLLREGQDHV